MKNRMKLWIAATSALILILTGCSIVPKETPTDSVPKTTQAPEHTQETVSAVETAKERFGAVLLNEEMFFNLDQGKEMTLSQFCEDATAMAEVDVALTRYALADLDADGIPELLLEITYNKTNIYGTLVLRYEEDITGYEFTYRQLMEIKDDGTFRYSSGAADNGVAHLRITDEGWEYEILSGVKSVGEEIIFFKHHRQISREEYEALMESQDSKPELHWQNYHAEYHQSSIPQYSSKRTPEAGASGVLFNIHHGLP